jgi:hypothetical protein
LNKECNIRELFFVNLKNVLKVISHNMEAWNPKPLSILNTPNNKIQSTHMIVMTTMTIRETHTNEINH